MRNHFVGASGKAAAVLALTLALCVPLVVFGAPAFGQSGSAQYQYSGSAQYPVTVCHHTGSAKHPWVTIRVASAGWMHGHSKHKLDFLVTPSTPCPPTAATGAGSSSHGKSGTHGKSSGSPGNSGSPGDSGTHGNSGNPGDSGTHGNSGNPGNSGTHGKP